MNLKFNKMIFILETFFHLELNLVCLYFKLKCVKLFLFPVNEKFKFQTNRKRSLTDHIVLNLHRFILNF